MRLSIGIAGAGSFAHFAATAFIRVDGITICAVTDISETAATTMAQVFNAVAYQQYDYFLRDDNISLVYIATPPYLHYQQSKLALLAGKHVICEKPAALHAAEAEELAALAHSLGLLYSVNLMQRYNPLYSIVTKIVTEKLLGNFLHGFFENYASDEKLDDNHWFWEEKKSGGIFIEHGVHFFDMFSGWLGKGRVISSLQLQRAGNKRDMVDRVQATVLYKDGTVNFYHGFDQPGILDRQEMRLAFERGEITLYGWIPVCIKLHGLLLKKELALLMQVLPGCSVEHHGSTSTATQQVTGRFASIFFDDHVSIRYGDLSDKQPRYQQMLVSMITDQWSWIKDRQHIRVVDSTNAVESLKMAAQANDLAKILIHGRIKSI